MAVVMGRGGSEKESNMREVLAQIHNVATSLENKKAFKQAEQLNNILDRIRNYEKEILISDIKSDTIDLKKFTNLELIRLEECKINTFLNAPITLKKIIFNIHIK